MNYLTHYYFNTRQPVLASASAEFHFGAALPDILSVYDRTLRFHPSHIPVDHNELRHGILNHLEMDTFFHRSEFFKNSYEEIRVILTQTVPQDLHIRPFFLAHVLVEILLDHLLLTRSADLAQRFYSAIDSIHPKDIIRLLEACFSRRLEGLEELINKFLVTRFLESYIELDNLVYPINRMLTRTRQQPFDIHDNSVVDLILQPSLLVVTGQFLKLTHEFERAFLNSRQ